MSVAGRTLRIDLDAGGRSLVDGAAVAAEVHETVRGRQWHVGIDGRSHEVTVLTREPLRLSIDGIEVAASALDERALAASRSERRHAAGRHEVRAPMPGLLKAIHVREGEIVEANAPLLILEAMKMENEIRAPAPGTVTRLVVEAGTRVEGGAVLVVLTAAE